MGLEIYLRERVAHVTIETLGMIKKRSFTFSIMKYGAETSVKNEVARSGRGSEDMA